MKAEMRAILLLGLGALILGVAALLGQDITGLWIIGSFTVVGLFLAWRRPRGVVGWLLVAFALGFETLGNIVPGSSSQAVDGHAGPVVTLMAWSTSWGGSLWYGTLVALAALFPTGRFAAGRVGVVGRVAVATPIVFAIALAFAPTTTVFFSDGVAVDIKLPLAVAPDWPGWPVIQVGVFVAALAALAAAIGTLIIRFRRASGSEREQYKWFLAALATTLGSVVFAFAAILILDPVGTWMWLPAVVAYPLIPVAIGIAVLRYRLYEIDRIISRTIGWAIVSGLLVGAFVLLVVGLASALAPLTGNSTLPVAGATLVVAALFTPVRSRVQRAVDRRFDRSRYDGERLLAAFGERLRDEVDLSTIRGEVLSTVDAAVRPSGAGLWLRRPDAGGRA